MDGIWRHPSRASMWPASRRAPYYHILCILWQEVYVQYAQSCSRRWFLIALQVNTEGEEMRDLAANLGVAKLPFFQIWRDADIVAAFTANISTVAVLRAEIARSKECTEPGCEM